MPRFKRSRDRDLHLERMFETRSEAWERVGLAVDVSQRAVRARAARGGDPAPAADRRAGHLLRPQTRSSDIGPSSRWQTPVRIGHRAGAAGARLGGRPDIGRAAGADVLPAHGSRHRRHGRLPDPAGDDRDPAAGRAQRRRRQPRHAGRRQRVHRGGLRSRRAADARATCSPGWCCSARGRSGSASGSASRPAPGRQRSRAWSARSACSTRPSPAARTGS